MKQTDREKLLEGLGLPTEGRSLTPQPDVEDPAIVDDDDDSRFTIPVSKIKSTDVAKLLEPFALDASDIADAKRLIDRTYRRGKNHDRAVALNAKANQWISEEKARRRAGQPEPSGHVRKKVKDDRETLDLAAQLREAGITAADLAELIANKAPKEKQ